MWVVVDILDSILPTTSMRSKKTKPQETWLLVKFIAVRRHISNTVAIRGRDNSKPNV